MTPVLEGDEAYQNAGEKGGLHAEPVSRNLFTLFKVTIYFDTTHKA